MLKAGILTEGELTLSDEGVVPQGSLCSPIFSNIVAHYVIDEWLEDTVKPLMNGNVRLSAMRMTWLSAVDTKRMQ